CNTRSATDHSLPSCASSWLPENGNFGFGPHQPFPFADVLAHEKLVRGWAFDRSVFEGLDPPWYAETAVHVNPFVFDATQTTLDLLKIGDVVDLTEIRKAFLRTHTKRVDVIQRVLADAAVDVINPRSVPDRIGFLVRNRLENLDVIAEQRKIGKDVDV